MQPISGISLSAPSTLMHAKEAPAAPRAEAEAKDAAPDIRAEPHKPSGVYYWGKDETGRPKLCVDGANRSPDAYASADHPAPDAPEPPAPKSPSETVTVNTDRVDREIEKLKRRQTELEQRLSAASGEEKKNDLQKELARIKNELSQKDNDAYRRQNAVSAYTNHG